MGVAEVPEQRRTLGVLFAAQVFGGAGLAAGVTVAALLAAEMMGTAEWAGLPTALFTLGSALAAVSVGRISQSFGRRPGLALGYLAGGIGAAGIVLAAVINSIPLLFISMFVYGSGFATNLQARYAGADLATPQRRGTAVSIVLVATAFGAVAGPNLTTMTGRVAEGFGIRALAGPFLLAVAAFVIAALVLWVFLRPDPLILARERALQQTAEQRAEAEPEPAQQSRTVWLAAFVMMVTQLVMVAIMTITPVHMIEHGHTLSAAALVISIHVGFMFLPAPLSGWLVDRCGARIIAAAGGAVMLAAGLTAAVANDHTVSLAIALALLGLGWSFGLVSGTAMLTAAVPMASRAKTQGLADLGIALAGAGGGLASGFVAAAAGYSALALAGGLIAIAIVPLAVAATATRTA